MLKGYAILCKLEEAINKKDRDAMITYSEQFYTNIPHNFGMQKMSRFIVQTLEQVKEKYDLVTNLLDMQIANKIMENSADGKKSISDKIPNPIDTNYS